MTGLETAFYIMAIIYMAVMFIIVIALLMAVIVIRAKVNRIHDQIEQKLDLVSNIAEKGGAAAALAGGAVVKKAKKAIRKAER